LSHTPHVSNTNTNTISTPNANSHTNTNSGQIHVDKKDKKDKKESKENTAEGSTLPSRRIYIMTLGVLARYRSYGIGTKLVQTILNYADKRKDINEIYLHVQVNNNYAINFYKRFGFEVGETLFNYYKRIQPPDCFVLTKKVNRHLNPTF